MKYDDRINGYDLSFDYRNNLVDWVKIRIQNDSELMARVQKLCEEEQKEGEEFGTKLTLQNRIDMEIEDMAEDAVNKCRIYLETEIDIDEGKFL